MFAFDNNRKWFEPMEFDRPGKRRHEKDCCRRLTFQHPWNFQFRLNFQRHLTLKMTSAQDVETRVTTNSPSQDFFHLFHDQIPLMFDNNAVHLRQPRFQGLSSLRPEGSEGRKRDYTCVTNRWLLILVPLKYAASSLVGTRNET